MPAVTQRLPFLKRYPMDGPLFEELLRYQRAMLRKPGDRAASWRFDYDFYHYFQAVTDRDHQPLAKKETVLTVRPKTVYDDIRDYARETVWYGRRRGATVYRGSELSAE